MSYYLAWRSFHSLMNSICSWSESIWDAGSFPAARQQKSTKACRKAKKRNANNIGNLLLEKIDKKSMCEKMVFIHFVEERLFFGEIVGIMSVI